MKSRIVLACMEPNERNYAPNKNKQNHAQRLEVRIFYPKLKRYAMHQELKIFK